MTAIGVGPYCDIDMDRWWVPVEAEQNRMKAAHEVRVCLDADSVLRYVGQEEVALDLECDEPCVPDPDNGFEYPPCTVTVKAWAFAAEARR